MSKKSFFDHPAVRIFTYSFLCRSSDLFKAQYIVGDRCSLANDSHMQSIAYGVLALLIVIRARGHLPLEFMECRPM